VSAECHNIADFQLGSILFLAIDADRCAAIDTHRYVLAALFKHSMTLSHLFTRQI
jgi:hypothetical protein